jgi:hypothetical protein
MFLVVGKRFIKSSYYCKHDFYSLVFACTEHYTGARLRLQCWRWAGRIPTKRVLRRLDYNNWSRRDLGWTCTTISLFVFFCYSVLVLCPLLIRMILLPAHQYEIFNFFQEVVTGGGEHVEDTVIGPDPANQEVASFLIC